MPLVCDLAVKIVLVVCCQLRDIVVGIRVLGGQSSPEEDILLVDKAVLGTEPSRVGPELLLVNAKKGVSNSIITN